jgi:THO complex subunit 3
LFFEFEIFNQCVASSLTDDDDEIDASTRVWRIVYVLVVLGGDANPGRDFGGGRDGSGEFYFSRRRRPNASSSYGTFRDAESEELAYAPTKRVTFAPAEPTFMTTFTLRRDVVKDAMASAEESERTVARLVGMLGGSLKSFYVTQTGSADGVLTYTFPKNHDSRTFTCLLRSVAKFETMDTVKLMTSVDAAQCAKAAAQVEKALRK